jgi:hypothetical protein
LMWPRRSGLTMPNRPAGPTGRADAPQWRDWNPYCRARHSAGPQPAAHRVLRQHLALIVCQGRAGTLSSAGDLRGASMRGRGTVTGEVVRGGEGRSRPGPVWRGSLGTPAPGPVDRGLNRSSPAADSDVPWISRHGPPAESR